MRRLRAAIARLGGVLSHARRQQAFDEELEFHLQMHVEDNLRAGLTPEEARRDALRRLGGLESARQRYREQATIPLSASSSATARSRRPR